MTNQIRCKSNKYTIMRERRLLKLQIIKIYTYTTDKQNALRRECTFKIEIVLEIGVAGINIY